MTITKQYIKNIYALEISKLYINAIIIAKFEYSNHQKKKIKKA